MKTLKLGLIPSPDLPAQITSKLVDSLPSFLNKKLDDSISWEPEIVIDPLVGSAEYMSKLMDKVIQIKNKNDWDFVICLTDLPHFMGKHVIVGDINKQENVALISLPAFGLFPVKQRIKQSIYYIMKNIYEELLDYNSPHDTQISRKTFRNSKKRSLRSRLSPIQRVDMSTLEKEQHILQKENDKNDTVDHDKDKDGNTQENTKIKAGVRYIIKYRLLGYLRILAGMTLSNRPWTALKSFKKVLVIAFGTGVYITIFPTPWELSTIYTIPRFILLMFAAIIGMVTWIIIAHNLWEKPTRKSDFRLRRLYNYTTISTLGVIVTINYMVLFFIFFAAIGLFVPPDFFEAITDIEGDLTPKYYLQLTWLSTSLGVLAGSIGTTGEDEEKIRQITYSYRQINRYYEIHDENEDENQNEAVNESKGDES